MVMHVLIGLRNWIPKNQLFSFFILFFICLKFPLLDLPLYWDAPAYNDLRLMSPDGIKYFLPWNTESLGLNRHPNGLQFIVYWFYQFFGYTVTTLHIMALSLSLLTLFSYYELIKKYMDQMIATLSVVFIGLSPIFFSQATQFLPDIPTISLSVFSLYLFLNKKYKLFIPISFLAGLISEATLGFSGALFLIAIYMRYKKEISTKVFFLSTIPSLSIVYYFLKQKIITGALVKHPAILQREAKTGFSWFDIKEENFYVLRMMREFILHNSSALILFILPISMFVIVYKRKELINRSLIYFILSALAFLGFFFVYGDYHPRNIFPVYNIIFIFLAIFLVLIKKVNQPAFVLSLFLCLSVLIPQNFRPKHTGDSVYSSYIDEVTLCRDTFKYIDTNNIPAPFYATFPIAYFFEDVGSGYVNRPLEIHPYYSDGQWNPKGRNLARSIVITNIEGNHRHNPVYDFIKAKNFKLEKHIIRGRSESWIFTR